MGERREYNPLPLFGNPSSPQRSFAPYLSSYALPSSFYKLLEYRRGNYIVTRVKRYFCFMAKEREKFRVAGSKLEYLRKPENSNFVETNLRTTESIEFAKETN